MKEGQTSVEDYIVPPDENDLDMDAIYTALRDGLPGVRALLLEDYVLCKEIPGTFYSQVRKRISKLDYMGPSGTRVYPKLGGLMVERDGREPAHVPWPKIIEWIQKRIRDRQWIGSMEAKKENAAAAELRKQGHKLKL